MPGKKRFLISLPPDCLDRVARLKSASRPAVSRDALLRALILKGLESARGKGAA